MNLFDANSIVTDLGLIGILCILFAETGLLIGLAFPGDSLLFIAGIAASATGAALLNGNQLPTLELFILAPIAAITATVLTMALTPLVSAAALPLGRRFSRVN